MVPSTSWSPDKIVVLSPSGEVGREIKLAPPQPDYRPYLLYLAGQHLAVGYSKAEKSPHKLQTVYALLDGSTGQPIRLYQPSPELGNSLVCFSSDGFIFYRHQAGDRSRKLSPPATHLTAVMIVRECLTRWSR
jgi:hypothetical protein